MVSSYEAGVCLWFSIAEIVNDGRERPTTTCPIKKWNKIKIFVKSWLRLFVDDTEDLVNCSPP